MSAGVGNGGVVPGRKHMIGLGSWNVRTLLPEAKPEQLVDELGRLGIGVACLQETRWGGSGWVAIKSSDGEARTFVYEGKTDVSSHSVAIALNSDLTEAWHAGGAEIWRRSPRVLGIPIHLPRKGDLPDLRVIVICVYAPTSVAPRSEIDEFYSDLSAVIRKAGDQDVLVVAGDFNARVGGGSEDCFVADRKVRGPYGCGEANSAGVRLLDFCALEGLTVSASWKKSRSLSQRYTWCNPGTRRWHCIDHVLVRQDQRHFCHNSRSMRGANSGDSDHSLVRARFCCPTDGARARRIKRCPPRNHHRSFPTEAIQDPRLRLEYLAEVQKHLADLPDDSTTASDMLSKLNDAITHGGEELDVPRRRTKGWFEAAKHTLLPLVVEKDLAWKATLNEHAPADAIQQYRQCKRRVVQATRRAREEYLQQKAEEAKEATWRRRNPWREVTGLLSEMRPRRPPPVEKVCTMEGEKCKGDQVLERWREHTENVLNVPSKSKEGIADNLPEVQPDPDLGLDQPPTTEEVRHVLGELRCGTASGDDGISPEAYKALDELGVEWLHGVFLRVWEEGRVPTQWRDAEMIPLPKKGDLTSCDNWRGISLLAVAGKAFARLLNHRLRHLAERVLPESQCGFRRGRSCSDMVFTTAQLAERAKEYSIPIHIVFIDLRKAYDSVPRKRMWEVLHQLGVPDRLIDLIKSLHEGMQVRVRVGNKRTSPVDVNNGLRQGCVLAPLLFILYANAVVVDWKQRCREGRGGDPGVALWSKPGGRLPFGAHRRQEEAMAFLVRVSECMFADDLAIIATSRREAIRLTQLYADTAADWGLTVSWTKTEVLGVGGERAQPLVMRCGSVVKAVTSFKYLGVVLHEDGKWRHAIHGRIQRAGRLFNSLRVPVFQNRSVTLKTKKLVFEAAVLGCLYYGAECWAPTVEDNRALDVFFMSCIRLMLGTSRFQQREERASNVVLLRRMSSGSTHRPRLPREILPAHRLRLLGHIARMDPWRPPQQILFSWFPGTRKKGVALRWMDVVGRDINALSLPGVDKCDASWFWLAQQRSIWSDLCTSLSRGMDLSTVRDEVKLGIEPALPISSTDGCYRSTLVCKYFEEHGGRYTPGRARFLEVAEREVCHHVEFIDDVEIQPSNLLFDMSCTSEAQTIMSRLHLLTKKQLQEVLRHMVVGGQPRRTKVSRKTKGDLVFAIGEKLRPHTDPQSLFGPEYFRILCDT